MWRAPFCTAANLGPCTPGKRGDWTVCICAAWYASWSSRGETRWQTTQCSKEQATRPCSVSSNRDACDGLVTSAAWNTDVSPKDLVYGELVIGKRPIWRPQLQYKDIYQDYVSLTKIKHFQNLHANKLFCHAHIQSTIDYGSTLRNSASAIKPMVIFYTLKNTTVTISDYKYLSVVPLSLRLQNA